MTPERAKGDSMKAYVTTTGAVFGLITLAHLLRVVEEGPRLVERSVLRAPHPPSTALCLWAWRVLRLTRS